MEMGLRKWISAHLAALPVGNLPFSDLKTNPFVLLIYARLKAHQYVSQLEQDILPAKAFSSMETSAGKMIEKVVLPVYGWQEVPSTMHSPNSVLDGKKSVGSVLHLLTLKSGPNTLDASIASDIAGNIVQHFRSWARDGNVSEIAFTFGELYGSKKQSNKKSWHILRKVAETLPPDCVTLSPKDRWDCQFEQDGVKVSVTVRPGIELWDYLSGSPNAYVEVAVAMIRACIVTGAMPADPQTFVIAALNEVASLRAVPDEYNVSLLQRSQLEWLFFYIRHYCDRLENT